MPSYSESFGLVGLEAQACATAVIASNVDGLASIVTHRDGGSEVGAWREGVPAHGRPVASVLQDLHLLVDHAAAAGSAAECIQSCWGSTLGGGTSVARSALGITGDGQLVWAAGERLSPAGIAQALVGAGVQRALELDINPQWVAGYLYAHRSATPLPCPSCRARAAFTGSSSNPTRGTSSRSWRGSGGGGLG